MKIISTILLAGTMQEAVERAEGVPGLLLKDHDIISVSHSLENSKYWVVIYYKLKEELYVYQGPVRP